MERTKFSVIRKRCLICGKTYPSDSKRTSCGCKDHGRLFAVGTYYEKKTAGR
ncbi:hypothetical protein [Lacrimispora xylanisolvens]|uniref:hypothetical protein n=1 Tax=Lacrimispora xylanisolvens TaxID=384636 RepID=UPI00147372D0|nr:hypothetical protein [Hungatella xylanolytica]